MVQNKIVVKSIWGKGPGAAALSPSQTPATPFQLEGKSGAGKVHGNPSSAAIQKIAPRVPRGLGWN